MSIEHRDIEDSTTKETILKVLYQYNIDAPLEDIADEIVKALDEAYDEEIKRIFGDT